MSSSENERQPQAVEKNEKLTTELEAIARENKETLQDNPEKSVEDGRDRAEQAREAIKQHTDEPEPAAEPVAPTSFVARINHVVNYSQTMQSVQRKLTPVSRSFSKVIHSPAVETASETLEKTVFRPSVTNGALWTAAVVGLFFFIVARRYGFPLSGSELIFSLLVGGLVGGGIEGLWHLAKRRR